MRIVFITSTALSIFFLLVPNSSLAVTTLNGEYLTQYGSSVATDEIAATVTPNGSALIARPDDDGTGVVLYAKAPEMDGGDVLANGG